MLYPIFNIQSEDLSQYTYVEAMVLLIFESNNVFNIYLLLFFYIPHY